MRGSAGATPWWAGRATVLGATALLTALRLAYAGSFELTPQEAYYWQYARHLDLSYFDHPPLAAWMIAVAERALGAREWAVRLPAVLSGGALTLLVFALGSRLVSRRAGALAALAANATILFGIGAVVMTPDVPLVLWWTVALLLSCELLLPDGAGAGRLSWRWYALGAACGLALLSKYTAALLPLQLLATALVLPAGRRWLRTPYPWAAALVALAVFSPVLLWNARHGWASFAFQTAGRAADAHGAHAYLAGRYLGLQVVAVGPVLYAVLLATIGWLARRASRGEPRAVLLVLAGAPGIALFTGMSPWIFVKMNWVAPAYLALLVGAAWWSETAAGPRGRRIASVALASGAALTLAAHLLPHVPALPFPARDALFTGWRELAAAVDRERGETSVAPLVVGWDYKTASELAFYLNGRPATGCAEALGGRGLAYEFWPAGGGEQDALVVVDERRPMSAASLRLGEHCSSFDPPHAVTVRRALAKVTTFWIWRCRGWHAERSAVRPRA